MIKKLLVSSMLCVVVAGMAQTTFTFTGDGNWSDSTQWENGEAPGIVVSDTEEVVILGNATIAEGVIITNQGSIEILNGPSGFPEFTVNGELRNETTLEILNATGVTVGSDGFINNSGAMTVQASNITNAGRIAVSGVLVYNGVNRTFDNIGTFDLLEEGTFINNVAFVNNGTVNVGNMGTFTSTRELEINSSFINMGTTSITRGSATINAPDGKILNSGTLEITDFVSLNVDGVLENFGTGSIIDLTEAATLRFRPGSELVNRQGSIINVNASTLEIRVDDSESITNNGDINIDADGRLNVENGSTFINDRTIRNNGTISTVFSNLNNRSGNLINNGELSVDFNGTAFSNSGTLAGTNSTHTGDYINTSGTLSPGDFSESGIYTISGGRYAMSGQSRLLIDIFSATDADKLISSESATLGGILEAKLTDGLTDLETGTSFTIVEGTSISGQFETLRLPQLPTGKAWEVDYQSTSVILRVIVDTTLSTTTPELDVDVLHIAPNPAQSTFAIQGLRGAAELEIYSITGQLVRNEVITNASPVAIGDLSSGYYVVRVGNQRLRLIKE